MSLTSGDAVFGHVHEKRVPGVLSGFEHNESERRRLLDFSPLSSKSTPVKIREKEKREEEKKEKKGYCIHNFSGV